RSTAGRVEVTGGPGGEGACGFVDGAELDTVAVGLLEVIAEDLVVLADAVSGKPLQPVCETFMERGAQLLRGRVVRGLAHEDVLEAVGGPTGGEGPGREADQVLPGQRGELSRDGRTGLLVAELDHGAAVEELALDGASLERISRTPVQPVEAG